MKKFDFANVSKLKLGLGVLAGAGIIGAGTALALRNKGKSATGSKKEEKKVYKDTCVENFEYQRPTKVFFGKGSVYEHLAAQLKALSVKKVLLVYGKQSIKRSGLYDDVLSILKNEKIQLVELSGIKPNPRIASARKGVEVVRKYQIDFILAVGAGSVIDCAKSIAAGSFYKGDVWDLFLSCYKDGSDENRTVLTKAVPLGCILTLAATGTEMNDGCVLSNHESDMKLFYYDDQLIPKFSILDPQYTYTVNPYQTKAGALDILSHCFEQYFSVKTCYVTDRFIEGVIKTVLKYVPYALNDPKNYEARSNIMWAGTLALNGLGSCGKKDCDWGCHWMEHEASAIYKDFSHGIGLGIITIGWMLFVIKNKKAMVNQICMLGSEVFNIDGEWGYSMAKKTVDALEAWMKENEIPTKFSEVIKFTKEDAQTCAKQLIEQYGHCGNNLKLNENEVYEILKSRI